MAGLDEIIVGVLVGVATAVIATANTFYVKDYPEERK